MRLRSVFLVLATIVAVSMVSCEPEDDPGTGTTPLKPAVNVSVTASTDTSVTASFIPNIDASGYAYAIGSLADIEAFDAGTIAGYASRSGNQTITFEGLTPGMDYAIFAQARAEDGTKSRIVVVRCETGSAPDPNAPRNVGYIASYAASNFEAWDWGALTHVNLAFFNPDTDGNPENSFGNLLERIIAKGHASGVKMLISFGGGAGSGNFASVITTESKRTNFCDKIIEFARRYDLDGIDLDIEESESNNMWANYEAMVIELKQRCTEEGLLLTTAVSTWYSDKITDATFECFDFVNIMSYAGHHSDHSSMEMTKTMADHYEKVRGIDKKRIIIGVPFYGSSQSDDKKYREILAADPQAWSKDHSNGYSYNGVATMRAKCRLAKEYGGIMIWELDQDVQGEHSLLGVIKENLFDSGSAPRPVMN